MRNHVANHWALLLSAIDGGISSFFSLRFHSVNLREAPQKWATGESAHFNWVLMGRFPDPSISNPHLVPVELLVGLFLSIFWQRGQGNWVGLAARLVGCLFFVLGWSDFLWYSKNRN